MIFKPLVIQFSYGQQSPYCHLPSMINSGYAYCSGDHSHDSSYLSTVRLVLPLGSKHLPALPSFKLDTRLVNTAIFKNCITNGLRTRIRIPTATPQTCHATWLHHTEKVERDEGIEPSTTDWKSVVLPLN